jgi:hypothetical protein
MCEEKDPWAASTELVSEVGLTMLKMSHHKDLSGI